MDTLYTFWENITHYKTDSVHFWGLRHSATKVFGFLEEVRLKPPRRSAQHEDVEIGRTVSPAP